MDEKIKQAWGKVKAFFQKMGKKTRRLLIAALALIVIAVAAFAVAQTRKPYSVLFTGLTSDDMSSVLSYLDSNSVTDYRVSNNDTILVPQSQEASLKAKLLMEGYPSSGFGYSTYLDNVGSLSTDSDRKTLYLFDLQDRLSAVVRCLDGVKDATVTIAQGEDHRYVLNNDNVTEATASVIVTMQGNQQLTAQQATAIRNLIGNAVQGLQIDNISITDTAGNTYTGADENSNTTDASKLKLELEEKVNNKLRNNILEVLIPLFGSDNVSVSVHSTVDVSRTFSESTTYQEPSWAADGSTGGKGIIGSRIYDDTITRDTTTTAGGVAGTETNSDISEYVEGYQPDGSEQELHTSGEVHYNVDTNHTQSENPAGVVSDVMVSVSINSNSAGTVNTQALVDHVARAAGIDSTVQADKISILAYPFYNTTPTPEVIADQTGLPTWVFYALVAGLVVFLILTIVLLLLHKKKKKKKAAEAAAAAAAQEQAAMQAAAMGMAPPPTEKPTKGASIMDLHSERSMELRKDVRQFAEDNPEIAAQLIKAWLKGGDERA